MSSEVSGVSIQLSSSLMLSQLEVRETRSQKCGEQRPHPHTGSAASYHTHTQVQQPPTTPTHRFSSHPHPHTGSAASPHIHTQVHVQASWSEGCCHQLNLWWEDSYSSGGSLPQSQAPAVFLVLRVTCPSSPESEDSSVWHFITETLLLIKYLELLV